MLLKKADAAICQSAPRRKTSRYDMICRSVTIPWRQPCKLPRLNRKMRSPPPGTITLRTKHCASAGGALKFRAPGFKQSRAAHGIRSPYRRRAIRHGATAYCSSECASGIISETVPTRVVLPTPNPPATTIFVDAALRCSLRRRSPRSVLSISSRRSSSDESAWMVSSAMAWPSSTRSASSTRTTPIGIATRAETSATERLSQTSRMRVRWLSTGPALAEPRRSNTPPPWWPWRCSSLSVLLT